ncbi:MAG: DUF5916 domain-containing protein [Gemmatimonadales bacterium]
MSRSTRWIRLVLIGLAVGTTGLAAQESAPPAGTAAFRPNVKPSLTISRAPGKIAIDGDLSDPGWAGAARATNFAEANPRENARPPVESEVWVTYDQTNFYLAFIAKDDPSSIRSTLTDRDRIWNDDYFGILLDTYGDAAWAYFLFANPKGIQGDSRFASNRGEDDSFDIIYRSEGKLTADGYVIEMAIPFESLRFPNRPVQTWRATFWRTRPRASREQHSWAAIDRNDSCDLCTLGTITGMEGVKPGGALELIPSAVATQSGGFRTAGDPASGFRNGSIDGDASLTAKYSFAGGLTAEGALNPDFSQVESDAGQIDVNTTFALFFPERRPFFQEGGDLFSTWINTVYTRSINDPLAAVKLIGRLGRTSVAYLGARDETTPVLIPFEERSFSALTGKSVSNILRVRQTFGRNSHLGGLMTDRRLDDGGSGTVAGVDALFGFAKNYQIEFQMMGSRTVEPEDSALTASLDGVTFAGGSHTAAYDGESFTGYAQYTSLERNARTWSFDIDYWASSRGWRADNGFETRNSSRRTSMSQYLTFYPKNSILERFNIGAFVFRNWNFDGQRKGQGAELGMNASLKGQTQTGIELSTFDERFREVEFEGLNRISAYIESNFSQPVTLGVSVGHGDRIARNLATPARGRGTDLEAWATIRPVSWIALRPNFTYAELSANGAEVFSGYILRTRADLQFTRELFLRFIVQYDDFDQALSLEPLLTYRANPFTLVYLGSNRGYRDFGQPFGWKRQDTQYFAKMQYLIRR